MSHLDFEKIIDKVGSKYEAVIRMAAIAKKIARAGSNEENIGNKKLSSLALKEYIAQSKVSLDQE